MLDVLGNTQQCDKTTSMDQLPHLILMITISFYMKAQIRFCNYNSLNLSNPKSLLFFQVINFSRILVRHNLYTNSIIFFTEYFVEPIHLLISNQGWFLNISNNYILLKQPSSSNTTDITSLISQSISLKSQKINNNHYRIIL